MPVISWYNFRFQMYGTILSASKILSSGKIIRVRISLSQNRIFYQTALKKSVDSPYIMSHTHVELACKEPTLTF